MSTSPQYQTLDMRALWSVLRRRRSWLFISTASFATLFGVAAFLLPPTYRASTVVVAASTERAAGSTLSSALGQLDGLASLAGLSLGATGAQTEETLAVLRSRKFTESFIVEENLLPQLYAGMWDTAESKWKVAPDEIPTPAKAFKYFNGGVRKILQDKKTGLITLQINWKDRNKAAMWANGLIGRLNAEMRRRAIAHADASVVYLEEELTRTTQLATREAIYRVMEAQIRQRMLANVTVEYALRVVDPALPPDIDDPAGPRKLILLFMGPLIGLAFGVIVIALRAWWAMFVAAESPDVRPSPSSA